MYLIGKSDYLLQYLKQCPLHHSQHCLKHFLYQNHPSYAVKQLRLLLFVLDWFQGTLQFSSALVSKPKQMSVLYLLQCLLPGVHTAASDFRVLFR